MQTTVKNTHGGKVTCSRIGPVLIALEVVNPLEENGTQVAYMTIDHAHVLGMGLVRLAEQAAAQQERAQGARCHGDKCAAGQIACPSPKACGVEA